MVIESLWHKGEQYIYYDDEEIDVFVAYENILKIVKEGMFYCIYIYCKDLDPRYEEKKRTEEEWEDYRKYFNELIGKVPPNKLIKINANEVSKIEYRL